MEAIMFKHG